MKNAAIEDLKSEAREMKLVYTSDGAPGYTRKMKGKEFRFFDTTGNEIKDEAEIKRINSLAIPPAWKNVWICPKPNGHLQATGIDTAGRKQYKYHNQWSVIRNQRKHDRMAEFAKALPAIQKKVEEDLSKPGFTREKVLAMAVTVMDKTFIRVGNEAYTKMYGSFGLTSLRNRHLKIAGNKIIISFRGKKGVFQQLNLSHSRLARMMRQT
nr:DNA topoisomerase I [uncultured bacterium]